MSAIRTDRLIYDAIQNLRAGRITPDQYRAIMHASRQELGETQHLAAHNLAVCADTRRNG